MSITPPMSKILAQATIKSLHAKLATAEDDKAVRDKKITELEGQVKAYEMKCSHWQSTCDYNASTRAVLRERYESQQRADQVMLANMRHELERLSRNHQTALEANAPFRNRVETLERHNADLRVRAERAEAAAAEAKKHFSARGFWLVHEVGVSNGRRAIPDNAVTVGDIRGWTDNPRAAMRWFRYGFLDDVETGQYIGPMPAVEPDDSPVE